MIAPVGRAEGVSAPCPVCESLDLRPKFLVGTAPILACRECGTVIGPRAAWTPTAPGLYGEDYFATDGRAAGAGYRDYVANSPMFRRTFRSRLIRIERCLGRTGRILDIGCALGYSLAEARDLGWEGTGLEISEHAAALSREINGVDVRVGRIGDVRFPEAGFDAIVMWDVIEHLSDPVAEVKSLLRWLKPGGLLHMVTPDVGSISSRVLGARWYHYKPGEHVVYFNRKSMARLLERVSLVKVRTAPTRSVMNLAYVLDRLSGYQPGLMRALQRLAEAAGVSRLEFWLDIGELEAWAFAPRG